MMRRRLMFLIFLQIITLPLRLLVRPVVTLEKVRGHRYPAFIIHCLLTKGLVKIDLTSIENVRNSVSLLDFVLRVDALPLIKESPVRLSFVAMSNDNASYVCRRYFDKVSDQSESYVLPYFAHPKFYIDRLYLGLKQSHSPRRIGVLFLGTDSQTAYKSNFHFPIMSRSKIIEYIRNNFLVETTITGKQQDLVFITTDDTNDTCEKHRYSQREYLMNCGQARFFLCPPGYKVPHAHNLIESMYMGAIPILNYHAYVFPPLRPNYDCLIFKNEDELQHCIRQAINMADLEVLSLRKNVLSYYEENLAPNVVGKKLTDALKQRKRVVVNDELIG